MRLRRLRLDFLAAAMLLPLAAGCGAVSSFSEITRLSEPVEPVPVAQSAELSLDQDFSEILSLARNDAAKFEERDKVRRDLGPVPVAAPMSVATTNEIARRSIDITSAFSSAKSQVLQSLIMPVTGVSPWDLDDNFGDPRDGGRRRHRGIDIFAPRGTELVAVTDGTITYLGEQPKAGRCLWLVTEAGVAFFYAHLDRWASGLYEGMPVRSGTLLGYVGNTGNAAHTSSHLHFAVLEDDDAVNPYPILRHATRTAKATPALAGGFGGAQ